MRFISQPQAQWCCLGSWRTSRRGRCAGSAARWALLALAAGGRFAGSRRRSPRPLAAIRVERLFEQARCSAFKRSDWAANFRRFKTAFSWVSFSITASLGDSCSRLREHGADHLAQLRGLHGIDVLLGDHRE